jgi:hypothetical protein
MTKIQKLGTEGIQKKTFSRIFVTKSDYVSVSVLFSILLGEEDKNVYLAF